MFETFSTDIEEVEEREDVEEGLLILPSPSVYGSIFYYKDQVVTDSTPLDFMKDCLPAFVFYKKEFFIFSEK